PDKKDYSKLDEAVDETFPASDPGALSNGHADDHKPVESAAKHAKGRVSNPVTVKSDELGEFVVDHGAVVIAAITSCTNTSNPQVMLGAALLARNAVEKGLSSKRGVKTKRGPGSKAANDTYN